MLLVLAVFLLPVSEAAAAPWLPQSPGLGDLDLARLFAADQVRQEQQQQTSVTPKETPVSTKPTVASTKLETYTVRRGDTLWDISRANGVTVQQLRSWNGLSGDLLRIGQVLRVGESKAATHTVQKGETLWSIATRYRTSVATLATANGLSSRGTIYPGERLAVPDGGQQEVSRSSGSSYRLTWPLVGTITSGWGYRTRFEKFHYGLDIAAKTGSPIKAVMSGVVQYAGWKNGYGYCVFLDHGNGVRTAYGHASKLYVKKGERVAQNETIAAVGSTGFSTGPHLHFEVRINGTLVNPINYLPK